MLDWSKNIDKYSHECDHIGYKMDSLTWTSIQGSTYCCNCKLNQANDADRSSAGRRHSGSGSRAPSGVVGQASWAGSFCFGLVFGAFGVVSGAFGAAVFWCMFTTGNWNLCMSYDLNFGMVDLCNVGFVAGTAMLG